MKRLTVLVLTLIVAGLSSCQKDPQTYCYDCTEYEVLMQSGFIIDSEEIDLKTFCGIEENQVNMLEGEYLIYQDSFNSIYRLTTCRKSEQQNDTIR